MRTLRRTQLVWIAVVVGMVAAYCRWWAWYGGIFYGPRFFLFASIPAALAIAVRLCTGTLSITGVTLSIVALVVSLWVGFTSSIGVSAYAVCTEDNYALEHLCWYTPEFSPLWRPLIELARALPGNHCLRACSHSASCSGSPCPTCSTQSR